MNRSKREDIVIALQDLLGTVTVANGYRTDIGSKVLYWTDVPDDERIDCIEFRDTTEQHMWDNTYILNELSINITAARFYSVDGLVGSYGNAALADLVKLITSNMSLGIKGVSVSLKSNQIESLDAGVVYVNLEISVRYRTAT